MSRRRSPGPAPGWRRTWRAPAIALLALAWAVVAYLELTRPLFPLLQ